MTASLTHISPTLAKQGALGVVGPWCRWEASALVDPALPEVSQDPTASGPQSSLCLGEAVTDGNTDFGVT